MPVQEASMIVVAGYAIGTLFTLGAVAHTCFKARLAR